MTKPDYCPVAQEPCQLMCVTSDVRCKIRDAAQPAPEQYAALEQALTRLQKRYGELEAKVAAPQEPIYQMQMMDGKWIDQAKQSYEYNKAHGNTVRIVYTTPPAAPVPITPAEVRGMAEAHGIDGDARHWYVVGIADSEKHHDITKGQP